MRIAGAIAAVAVVAAAFFAARLADHDRCQDTRQEIFGAAVFRQPPPAGTLDDIRESCRGAASLVAVAGALHTQGRDRDAAPLAREATEREPENAAAWHALAESSQAPAEARAAERRFTELDPLGARSLKRSAGRSTR